MDMDTGKGYATATGQGYKLQTDAHSRRQFQRKKIGHGDTAT